MPKHEFTVTLTITGVESEINATAVFDYSVKEHIVEIYDVYCDKGEKDPYLYIGNYLSNAQYDALEAEILRSMEV